MSRYYIQKIVIGIPVSFDPQVVIDTFNLNSSNLLVAGKTIHLAGYGPNLSINDLSHPYIIGLQVSFDEAPEPGSGWLKIPDKKSYQKQLTQLKEMLPDIKKLLETALTLLQENPEKYEFTAPDFHSNLSASDIGLYVGSYYG